MLALLALLARMCACAHARDHCVRSAVGMRCVCMRARVLACAGRAGGGASVARLQVGEAWICGRGPAWA